VLEDTRIVTDLLKAFAGRQPGGPGNDIVEVFPSCSRMDRCYITHGQVTSQNTVWGSRDMYSVIRGDVDMFLLCVSGHACITRFPEYREFS
jgi:hypothetical protein